MEIKVKSTIKHTHTHRSYTINKIIAKTFIYYMVHLYWEMYRIDRDRERMRRRRRRRRIQHKKKLIQMVMNLRKNLVHKTNIEKIKLKKKKQIDEKEKMTEDGDEEHEGWCWVTTTTTNKQE